MEESNDLLQRLSHWNTLEESLRSCEMDSFFQTMIHSFPVQQCTHKDSLHSISELAEKNSLRGIPILPDILALGMYTHICLSLLDKEDDDDDKYIPDIIFKGLRNLFLRDLETNSFVFVHVYRHLWELLLRGYSYDTDKELLSKNNTEKHTKTGQLFPILKLVFQFFFLYEQRLRLYFLSSMGKSLSDPSTQWTSLPDFLWQCSLHFRRPLSSSSRLLSRLLSRPSGMGDLFVEQSLFLAESCKNTVSLLKYINEFQRFRDWKLRVWTRNKLQVFLYRFSAPGSPCYRPRAVRMASQRALDALFPEGRNCRSCVRFCFRLSQPHYIPSALFYWWLSVWEWLCHVLVCVLVVGGVVSTK